MAAGIELLSIPFGLSLAAWSLTGLLLHALASLASRASAFKRYTSKQMLIALAIAGTSSVGTGVRTATRMLQAVLRWWLFWFLVFLLFSTMYVTFTEFPETWIGGARMYNQFVGPYANQVVLLPLQMLDLVLRGVLPVWNSAVWFLKTLAVQGLLPVLLDQAEIVVRMAGALVSLVQGLSEALVDWFTSFLCRGTACLQPERGVLNLFPSMLAVREFSLLGAQLGHAFCGTLAAPLDILLYPLLDVHLTEAVHSVVNAALQLVAVIPHTTAVRCQEHAAGDQFAVLMCTPDLAPFFNFLAAGMSSLGLAIDNWVNVAFLIVESVLGGSPPRCDASGAGVMIPDLLAADAVFAGPTVVVGLTDWLYAVTDGRTALYLGHNDGAQAKVGTWPFSVDTSLGVAAVGYSTLQDLDVSAFSSGKTAGAMQTTAMLGCNCSDTADAGMRVLCAILPMSGVPTEAALEDYRLEVLFSDPAASRLYTCAGVDLYVRPVRWSYTRYEARPEERTHDCISRGTCRELDATVWLIPRCAAGQNAETACIPTAPCIPFCMAARSAGSGRGNLALVRAGRWRDGATILGQDCTLADAGGPNSVQLGLPRTGMATRADSTRSGLLQTGGTAVYGVEQPGSPATRICQPALGVTSIIPKAARAGYNVVLEGQPFALTGDTILTTVELGGGAASVQVERLEGDETDVFSLNSLNQQLPAHPKAVVPLAQAELDSQDRLTIPYGYQTSRVVATSSRNFVFYATNPNADVLGPYLEYCADRGDPDKLAKFGILFASSYSLLRVYRVSAYRRCAAYSCGGDLTRFVTLDGFSRAFGRECDEVFNVSVSALEYLNEDNIAVTLEASPVTAWDAATGAFTQAVRTTYWLHPATMRVRRSVWQTDPASTGIPTQIPPLCPALQRLPRVGTFAAELLNAGVFLVRYAVYVVAYTPGLVAVWRSTGGARCPAPGSSLHHSVLANCGERVYSLDDFFDSLDDAASVFWHGLSLVARLIAPPSRPEIARPITNVLDGMSQYGQGAVDVWAGGAGVLTLTRAPIREQAMQVWATVQAGTAGDGARMVMGLSSPGAGALAWSRFAYRLFSQVGLGLLKRFLDPLQDVTLAGAFRVFWADLYDLRDEFSATVTARMRLACGGIKVMFGGDNPWAGLLYHQCAAGAELGDGMLRLALDVFVLIPMAKCVCKDVSGRSVPSAVTRTCAPPLPVSLLPTLYTIANELMGTRPVGTMACERVLDTVKNAVGAALDPFFAHQFLALDALGSSVEYVTATFDDQAGRCLDFQNDPHVVVIVPQPVDYFHRCAGTSMCRQACSAEWRAFQDADAARDRRAPDTVTVAMESLFFPGELDEDLALTNVSASVELPPGLGSCLLRAGGQPQDFALALAEVSVAAVRVQFWCVPRIPSSTVYRSDRPGFGPLEVPGALLDLQFGDDTGAWLAALAQVGPRQAVFLLNSSGAFEAPPVVDALLGDENTLLRVENLWVVEGFVVVDVLARRLVAFTDPETGRPAAESQPVSVHLALLPPLGDGLPAAYGRWRTTDVDLLRFGRGAYWYTRLADGVHLFLPKTRGLMPARVRLARANDRLSQKGPPEVLAPSALPAMDGASLAARSQGADYAFATSRSGWDWLRQVRVSVQGRVEGVHGSAGVQYDVDIQGTCDALGCEGCASVQVQRLCLAYQKCALVNCVGTPVHQRRPLCGIGGLLRQTGRLGLLSTQGAWAIFTEMLALALRLSLLNLKEAYLLWPEDQFLCYMCQAKDSSAQFFSILTATVNAALQLGRADLGYMYGGASNVDTNADAVLTISTTAINAFMHQMTLLPLYGLAVSHQILMCQVSGVIALVPTGSFRVSIRMGKDTPAGDLIAGQCLTMGAEVLASFPRDDAPSLGATVTSLVSNALERLLIAQIEPLLHITDGMLAYLIGVGRALGGLVQSQNMARCSPPEFFLKDVVRCACGDHELQIPDARRAEGVRAGALWCTGVLGMLDSNNQPYYIHNPFTYAQLQAKSAQLQAYVDCVGSAGDAYRCEPPNDPVFENQGVTTVNVLVKCRENFLKRRWDPSAHMLFRPALWDLIDFQQDPVVPTGVAFGIAQCLSEGDASSGSLVQRCHEEFLLDANVSSEAYWQYERVPAARAGRPENTDACLVFTGPADKQLPLFQACVDGGAGNNCTLPAHLWTPLSDNDVPLATQHRVLSHGDHRDGLVQALYRQARATVLDAIRASMDVWNASSGNPEVQAQFFSAEGDVLHQTMDCIFMGPYSRVDYWPIPACRAGEECLRGPFWSRDEAEGGRRHVDPSSCEAPASLPYTCGSPGRRSLMRYLVLHLLPGGGATPNQNESNVGAIVRATLEDLAARWEDPDRYGCSCADASLSPACCASNLSSPLLPDHLRQPFDSIKAETVLAALQDDMAHLYNLALESRHAWNWFMQDVAPRETQAYDWSGSSRAEEEALFDPTEATVSYSSSAGEAMSPLLEEDSTLWDVCHAALKQVFFTLPVDAGGTVRFPEGEFDGDPARLEEFVVRFTEEAFRHSPLFRHYAPRHAPSESQMCAQPPFEGPAPGSVPYDNFVQAGQTLLRGQDLPSGRAAHPQMFRVGAEGCLCGWPRRGDRCFPPTQGNTLKLVCDLLGTCLPDGSFPVEDGARALADFSLDWHCPETELSAHWGYLDPSANELWLGTNRTSNLHTSARDLFRHGRSGLRPGNLQTLPDLAKQYVSPATREVPLERGRLTTCDPPPLDEDLLVRPFLDQLFPAAQAVEEAGALAYCLRYAIELARRQVLRLLLPDHPELEARLAAQAEVAERWRKRCGTQLHLLHVCVSLGAFRPLFDTDSRAPVACPHFRVSEVPPGRVVYVTPACLVSVDGVFYDPCRAIQCQGGGRALPLAEVLAGGDAWRIRFDPRAMLRRGAPIGWIDGQHPLPDPEEALLRPGFAREAMAQPAAAGNAPEAGAWWSAEGPMERPGELCDGVLDWWPDDWDFPVGYHVTVPCEANETAYRGFVQAFALDEEDHSLVYQHDLLRDAALVDSHFGGTGLCRAGSFGMPMPETNNMRYCTQIPEQDEEDFALPPHARPPVSRWTEWACTASSSQLPWPSLRAERAEHQSSRFSVGTIPNMPPETARTYPANHDAMFSMGPWQELEDARGSWGPACQDFAMLYCGPTGAACPAGFACRGLVCLNQPAKACAHDSDCRNSTCRGVCVDPAVECIRHRDCAGGRMCSGVGTCEQPVLSVQNRLPTEETISLSMAAREGGCGAGAREYSLLQGSYWGNTGDDVLRVHGMCSFEDWFKYTRVYATDACSKPADNETRSVDPERCQLVDLQQLDANQSTWWPQGSARPALMFMRPTLCDRDYERLQGFTQCSPHQGAATLLSNGGIWASTALQYDRFARLHSSTGTRAVLLADMDERNETRTGFLGMGGELRDGGGLAGLDENPFVACGGVGQCYPPRFTVNGAETRRMARVPGGWANYSDRDTFVCGAFGVLTAGGCAVDTDRFPLYRLLCVDRVASCRAFDDASITRACAAVQATYQPSNQDRVAVLQGLRELFYALPLFSTIEVYLRVTQCVHDLYAAHAAHASASQQHLGLGLYFPFMFALYEVPFDWFYQCIVMSGRRIQPDQHAPQNCQAYATRAQHTRQDYEAVATGGDTLQAYLQHVRAGYLPADIAAYRAQHMAAASTTLAAVFDELVRDMFPASNGVDLSYPRCSRHILWRVGDHGNPYDELGYAPEQRAVIWNWHDTQSCALHWHELLLKRLEATGVETERWVEELTDYDPVNMVRQDRQGPETLLGEARAYMLSQLGVEPLPTVVSDSSGALRFRAQPPPAYDSQARPLPASLVPTVSSNDGTASMDESVPRTCVFLPAFDPAFARLPQFGQPSCGTPDKRQTGSRTDHLRTCGAVECSSIPIYYKRNGRFNCRYVADKVISSGACTENDPGCEARIMDQVYAAMLERYRAAAGPTPPVLPPRDFPWFAAGWASFEAVDLSGVLDYERNIQPDPRRAVMCEISSDEASAVQFTTCNNPHYLRLKRHVNRHYKHDGAVLIPPRSQLEWPVHRAVLARGVMLSYANTNRSLRKRYMDGLFDDEAVCKGDQAQHVCRKEPGVGQQFRSLNPWLLGHFNPYEVCDVDFTSPGQGSREYIYTFCAGSGNSLCADYDVQAPDTCKAKHRRLVQQVGVPRHDTTGAPNGYNLCFHAVDEDDDGCMHDQGLLGGYDGLPVASPPETSVNMLFGTKYAASENYTVAPHLYAPSRWSIPADFEAGLFEGANPLWQGADAPYGFLQVNEDEIGGHRIGVAVARANASDLISAMYVERLAMGVRSAGRMLDDAATGLHVREWVAGLQDAMADEDEAVLRLYQLRHPPRDLGPSCPLQRWAFYSGDFPGFSPRLPAAKRAQHLFHRVHSGRLAHPTMLQGASGRFLGKYRSSNGFCACPVIPDIGQVQCLTPIDSDQPCSLTTTMQALRGGHAVQSFAFPPINNEKATRPCQMQLDWPLVDGTLRDGTALPGQWGAASNPSQRECHVLDRFRRFRYKYQAASTLAPSGGKNTVRDGVCKTRRLVSLQEEADQPQQPFRRCLVDTLFDTSALLTCNTTAATFSLPRRARLTLAEVLARRQGRQVPCGQCARPPAFRSEQGRPIQPESSFGRLHRTSPERRLAEDLRRAICPPNATRPCPALNESSWRAGAFMHAYMHSPHLLFLSPNRSEPAQQPPTTITPTSTREDPALWTRRPWVYCPTAEALRTGEGCEGTISRAEWERDKTTLCPRMVQSYSARVLNGSDGDPMARTTFCPIDSTTDGVCQAITKARELIRQANCIARGDPACMPSPFVYHPASYEPSNNAWVHDSVKSFYTRLDARACPHNTSTDASLVQFAKAYQRSCPANAVNVFVGVLRAVRVVVVDVALLGTTLLGMAFRTLQLLSTGGRDAARSQIGRNWAYIRSKARETLNTVGDLLVDTMLNSGEVGERIMGFLHKACESLNSAVEWYLNVWCNYIQRYTVQFLAGIRKLLGITGAGFDILQDFMDEVFQGILPAAFVAKYASGNNFQNMLSEFYSQPSKKKQSKVTVDGVQVLVDSIPDSANPKQVSRSAQQKSILGRLYGAAGTPFRAIAKAGAFLGGALLGLELVQGIISLIEEERLRKLYPQNFTLFDLSDVANAVDALEEFILSPFSQQTCASFQLLKKAVPDYQVIPCLDLRLDKYEGSGEGATSIEPTMCWASAAPSLGQNSMFSCTASSTCRPAPGSTEVILCATCPDPTTPGVTKYGCDALQLQCACSTLRTTHTRCAANRECSRPGTECELRSSLSPVSYGTIPCANCPTTAKVMCSLPPAGMPARCTCMLAGAPTYDLCNDRAGARTPVDPTRLCGYLHNRKPDSRWDFDMQDLILLPCAQVSTGVCSDVFLEGEGRLLRMVVAETLRTTAGGRRLLSDEEVAPEPGPPVYDAYESEYELPETRALHELLHAPGWNTTAAPCSTLALAYQAGTPLGLLETHVLHTCGFWRYVGRRVLARYNLTAALSGHETFLLSMDDLVYAAMSPGVALALLSNPGVFASALAHHPWMKPVRALGVAVANQLEYLTWMRVIDADVHEALFGDVSPEEQARQARQDATRRIQERIITPRTRTNTRQEPKKASAPPASAPVSAPASARRRLLTAGDVLAYSARVIASPDSAGFLPLRVYGAWSTADFVWPPRYNYSLAACPIGMSALDLGVQVALINKMYFENFARQPPRPDRSLRGNLPDWSWLGSSGQTPERNATSSSSSWASAAFRWMLGLAGARPEHLVRFFTSDQKWSLTWILVSLTQCDLASTLTCSRHDKDLLMSTVIFVLLYLAVSTSASALGVGFMGTLFLLSYPWFILWYAFGMAPTCAPLLPTCLLADVIATVEAVLPRRLLFPANLVCDANQTCLRSCTELNFQTWADPLAFAVCDTDQRTCRYLQALPDSGIALLDEQLWTPARQAMVRFGDVVELGLVDLAGHRLCTWVSFITAVPVLALLGSFVLVSGALVGAAMDILPPVIGLVCQSVVFYESP